MLLPSSSGFGGFQRPCAARVLVASDFEHDQRHVLTHATRLNTSAFESTVAITKENIASVEHSFATRPIDQFCSLANAELPANPTDREAQFEFYSIR